MENRTRTAAIDIAFAANGSLVKDMNSGSKSSDNGGNGRDDCNKSLLLLSKARSIWLAATSLAELEESEQLYRSLFYETNKNDDEENSPFSKRQRTEKSDDKHTKTVSLSATTTTTTTATATNATLDIRSLAGEKLAMLLLQSGRVKEADSILSKLNYTCRLSSQVLNYPFPHDAATTMTTTIATTTTTPDPPCRIYDNFLNHRELKVLQEVFLDPNASYWTDHDYKVEPCPSPYFSHVIPLNVDQVDNGDDDKDDHVADFGFLRVLIDRILGHLQKEGWKHNLIQQCTHVEMWAHNRPHCTGHQLHFDSDNEGQGDLVRHPLASSILYLNDCNYHTAGSAKQEQFIGGPSLITNQRRISRQLATKGWLVHAKMGRLTTFDGRVLHGVIPGKGVLVTSSLSSSSSSSSSNDNNHNHPQPRRVTLMLAFWKNLETRNDGGLGTKGGAARAFPFDTPWAKLLRQPYQLVTKDEQDEERNIVPVSPIPLDHVYETVAGHESCNDKPKPWTPRMGMPLYDGIYQGF